VDAEDAPVDAEDAAVDAEDAPVDAEDTAVDAEDAPVDAEDAPEEVPFGHLLQVGDQTELEDARIEDLIEEVSSLKVNSCSESNPLSCHTQ